MNYNHKKGNILPLGIVNVNFSAYLPKPNKVTMIICLSSDLNITARLIVKALIKIYSGILLTHHNYADEGSTNKWEE